MKLLEIEALLIEHFDIEHYREKCKRNLNGIFSNKKHELYMEVNNELAEDITPLDLIIVYDSSELHFDHVDGCGPFVRLRYLLYLKSNTNPLYNYDVDIDDTGVVTDDYLMKW